MSRLRWDARDRPLGLVQFEPRLQWVVSSAQRGQRQTAYQILVASEPGRLQPGKADIWDSHKVTSGESLNVRYGGPTPVARQRAYFTVRVWDKDDRPSAFAPASWWEMGLLDEEWEGQWIGRARQQGEPADTIDRSANLLRRTFSLPRSARRARLYVTAFGLYEMWMNGKRVGDDVLAPGFTDYEKRVLFQTYDVTSLLRQGENVLGAYVGGGWCTAGTPGRAGACGREPPRIMVQLEVTMADGDTRTIISDRSWRTHPGPIVSSHLHDGESYDARRELPGWSTPGFDDAAWAQVDQYDKEIERDIAADPGPPIRVAQELAPVRVTEPAPGVHVFDLGQNMVGWARLRTRAAAGTTVALRFGEALNPDGTLHVANLGGAEAVDRYIARGQGVETWEPRFSVRGFRYVEVTGLPGRPAPGTVVGRVVHSVMPETGLLETSNPKLDRLFANILWSQRGAFLGVPTAGSQRGEGIGSMLAARVFATTGCLNRDVQTFYRKWIDDIRDAQQENAAYADRAPAAGRRAGGPGAGTAGVLVPWALYRCYADRPPLDAHLASMGRFLELVRARNPGLLWTDELGANVGDPYELGPGTDRALIATAELAFTAQALAQIARHGGSNLDPQAHRYETIAQGTRAAFARKFVTADGKLTSDTQTAYALAIGLGVVSDETRARMGRHLVAAIEREGKRLTTGVLGAAYVLPALSLLGRDDLAYDLLFQEECPSWLCSVQNGATTLWERWDAWDPKKGLARPGPVSLNHYAFGAVGEWMYDAIGGIALDPTNPGGRHILVRPRPGRDLRSARARYDSLHGPVSTEWRHDPGRFRLKVSIPPNASATVTLPIAGQVTESGRPLEKAPGVKVLPATGPARTLAIEAGSYDFLVVAP